MGDLSNVVLVDMDGVLADFDRHVVELLGVACPELCTATTRTDFYLKQAYPQYAEQIRAVTSAPGFFASLPLIDDAQEGWERIKQAGFVPRICSAPLVSHDACADEKRAWLAVHFGDAVAEEAIIDGRKDAHPGIALIDDRPYLRGSDEAQWQHIVFDTAYNRQIRAPRLCGWLDPDLPRLLADARER